MSAPEAAWRTAYRHPTPWDMALPPLSLVAMFEDAAARRGEAPLIDFLGRRYSYRETLDGANRVACGLAKLGYGRGDRIGLFLPNVPHYVAAYYGALKLGATVVNFSPLYTATELAHQIADSGTRILFTLSASALLPTALKVLDDSALERLVVGSVAGALPATKSLLYRLFKRREVTPRPDDPRVTAFSRLIANDGACASPAIDPERDIALIQYTGGTTGAPKGAMLTHQNLSANARQVEAIDPASRRATTGSSACCRCSTSSPTPACSTARCSTAADRDAAALRRRAGARCDRADQGDRAARRADHVPGAARPSGAGARPISRRLRVCISGGAPLPAELKDRFEAATGARLVEGYGLTESSGVVSTNPYEGEGKPGTIGQPLPATRLRLVDKEDPSTPRARRRARRDRRRRDRRSCAGYWNRPDADADTFVADAAGTRWLRTGDVGDDRRRRLSSASSIA